jgi:hypothetical protein
MFPHRFFLTGKHNGKQGMSIGKISKVAYLPVHCICDCGDEFRHKSTVTQIVGKEKVLYLNEYLTLA